MTDTAHQDSRPRHAPMTASASATGVIPPAGADDAARLLPGALLEACRGVPHGLSVTQHDLLDGDLPAFLRS